MTRRRPLYALALLCLAGLHSCDHGRADCFPFPPPPTVDQQFVTATGYTYSGWLAAVSDAESAADTCAANGGVGALSSVMPDPPPMVGPLPPNAVDPKDVYDAALAYIMWVMSPFWGH